MAKLNIITEPDPILRKKSEVIEKIDDDLKKLLNNMLETMYDAPGIGPPVWAGLRCELWDWQSPCTAPSQRSRCPGGP